MYKRVDFSVNVITPDPNIELDELGVPIKIATNLTFQKINKFNIRKTLKVNKLSNDATRCQNNLKNGTLITLNDTNKDDIILELGDTLNRHLLDGDYVLFNRQPSSKATMQRIKVKQIHLD